MGRLALRAGRWFYSELAAGRWPLGFNCKLTY